jgi:hypothetical protein
MTAPAPTSRLTSEATLEAMGADRAGGLARLAAARQAADYDHADARTRAALAAFSATAMAGQVRPPGLAAVRAEFSQERHPAQDGCCIRTGWPGTGPGDLALWPLLAAVDDCADPVPCRVRQVDQRHSGQAIRKVCR